MLSMHLMMLASQYYDWTDLIGNVFIAIVAGIVVAAFVVGGMIRQLRTAVPKREANDYVKMGSLHLRIRKDQFLYKQTVRSARSNR